MIKQASKEVPRFFSFADQLPLRGLYRAICHLFKRLKDFGRVLLFKTFLGSISTLFCYLRLY